jgi:hypothetical protein
MSQKATLFFVVLATVSCSSKEPPAFKADGTPSFRAEVFSKTRSSQVFESSRKCLQNAGYDLKDVNPSLGYISAIKIFDMETYQVDEPFGPAPSRAHQSDRILIEANLHIVQLKGDAKVRINLTQKVINISGEVIFASPVSSADSYDQLIDQIKSIEFSAPTPQLPPKKQK